MFLERFSRANSTLYIVKLMEINQLGYVQYYINEFSNTLNFIEDLHLRVKVIAF